MIMLKFLIMPVFGAFTGYITNYFAIKMLFRPHKPYFIGKFHIPLTPGLIIREKERISKSIGNVVGENLLSKKVFEKTLLSDKILKKINSYIHKLIFENEQTIAEFISPYVNSNAGYAAQRIINDEIIKRLENFSYGEEIADIVLRDNLILGMMSKQIGSKINEGVSENAEEILKIIQNEIGKELQRKISDIASEHKEDVSYAAELITELYKEVVETKLETVLENMDISEMIQDKITEFNVIEFEDIILSIVKKELNIIEYLGAVFGFVLGMILAFFSF